MAVEVYQPDFEHDPWIDNVDLVQAGGERGFNLLFDQIQIEFDKISKAIERIDDFLDTIGSGGPVPDPLRLNKGLTVMANVGIGAETAKAKLDIKEVPLGAGSHKDEDMWFSIGNGDDQGRLWIEQGEKGAPLLVLSDQNNPPRIQFQQTGTGETSTEARPDFESWIGHGKGDSANIAIMPREKNDDDDADIPPVYVGIGTDDPQQELHVVAKEGNADVRVELEGADFLDLFSGKDRAGLWSRGKRPLEFGTDGQERMRIDDKGNVGIGTQEPNRKLSIFDKGKETGVYANIKNDSHEILFGVGSTAIVSAMTASDLQFRTNNANRMVIKANNGSVEIPGDLSVGGTFDFRNITRGGKAFTKAGRVEHNTVVEVPFGEVSDWNCLVSPSFVGYNVASGYEDDNALLKVDAKYEIENDSAFRIIIRYRYRDRARDGKWYEDGWANYLLVPK